MVDGFTVLRGPVTGVRRLKAGRCYVVMEDVRIAAGGTLAAEDGVTILILNGHVGGSETGRAALVFEQGSSLRARRLAVRACDSRFRRVRVADNGGLWFMGAYRSAAKDGRRVSTRPGAALSSFRAEVIAGRYLGRHDPAASHPGVSDDIDGISVLGVGPQEWEVAELQSFHSGDDGVDLTNAHIRLQRLRIASPAEDGINLSSSTLQVSRSLRVDVSRTSAGDREVFDLEVDDGPSCCEIARNCHVDLRGAFGDELRVSGTDLLQLRKRLVRARRCKGVLRASPGLVYSLDKD